MTKLADNDQMTCIVALSREMRRMLRDVAGLGPTEYRLLAFVDAVGPGALPSAAARVLELSPATVTHAAGKLKRREFISQEDGAKGMPRPLSLMPSGRYALAACDGAPIEYVSELLSVLDDELRPIFPTSSLLTTAQHRKPRMREGAYFAEYAFFEGTLMTEQFFITTTRMHGLTLDEFRVLQRISGCDGMRMSGLCADLLMSRSDASEACSGLAGKGFASVGRSRMDRRGKEVAITPKGEAVRSATEKGFEDFTAALRATTKGEVSLFNRIWRIIAREKRRGMR